MDTTSYFNKREMKSQGYHPAGKPHTRSTSSGQKWVPKQSPQNKHAAIPGVSINISPKVLDTVQKASPTKPLPTISPMKTSPGKEVYVKSFGSPTPPTTDTAPKDTKEILESASGLTTSSLDNLREIRDMDEKNRERFAEENAKLMKELQEAKETSTKHEHEKSTLQQIIEDKNGRISTLEEKLGTMRERQENEEAERKLRKEQIASCKEKIPAMSTAFNSLKEGIKPITEGYADFINQLTTQMLQLKEKIQKVSADEAKAQEEIKELKEDREKLAKKIDDYDQVHEKDLETLKTECEAIHAELKAERIKVTEAVKAKDEYKSLFEEENVKSAELKKKLEDKTYEGAQWKHEVDKWRENFIQLKQDKEKVEQKLAAEKEEIIGKQMKEQEEYAKKVSELNHTIQQLRIFYCL